MCLFMSIKVHQHKSVRCFDVCVHVCVYFYIYEFRYESGKYIYGNHVTIGSVQVFCMFECMCI